MEADILRDVTATRAPQNRPSYRYSHLRSHLRGALAAALLLGLVPGLVLTGGPALADVPVGWTEPDDISLLGGLSVFVFIPVAAIIVISLLAAAPGIIKGEGILGPQPTENQWLGGPGETPQLESTDSDQPTGGASGSW